MTSILTNIAANTALLTLQQTVKNLQDTQNRVSTGKRINTAADNAAYFSIATTLSSDSSSLSAVTDALNFGASTLDTQTAALKNASDVVSQIKAKLVTAATPGIDRTKIQGDLAALQQQLSSIATSASFNGQNFLAQDSSAVGYNANKSFVASFARDASGVAVGTINIDTSSIKLFDNKAALTSLQSQGYTVTQNVSSAVATSAITASNSVNAALATNVGAFLTSPQVTQVPAAGAIPAYISIKTTDENLNAGSKTVQSEFQIANSALNSNFNASTDISYKQITPTSSLTLNAAIAATGITGATNTVLGKTFSSYNNATQALTLTTFTQDAGAPAQVFVNQVTIKNVLPGFVAGGASAQQTTAGATSFSGVAAPAGVNAGGSVSTVGSVSAATLDAFGNLTLTAKDANATPNYITQTVAGAVLSGSFKASTDVSTITTALGAGSPAGSTNTVIAGAQAGQTYTSYNANAKQLTVTTFTQDGTSVNLLATTTTVNNVVAYGKGLLDRQDATTTGSSGTVSGQVANDSLYSIDVSKLGDDDKSLAKLNAYTRLADQAVTNLATAASQIGSASSRIKLQQSFVTALKTSIDQGVGALVDADLNIESTRLQALQVQQQLGVQSLSIANQSTSAILKLFQ